MRPSLSLVVSLLLSLISTLVLSWARGVLFHLNSLTHRFARFPPRNLCSLVMLAVSSLVFAATDTYCFQVLISLGSAELSILPAAPVDTFPRHLPSHFALSSYRLFVPLTLWRLSISLRPLVQTLGSCPAFGAPWSSTMPPSLGRCWVNNNNNLETHTAIFFITETAFRSYLEI